MVRLQIQEGTCSRESEFRVWQATERKGIQVRNTKTPDDKNDREFIRHANFQ